MRGHIKRRVELRAKRRSRFRRNRVERSTLLRTKRSIAIKNLQSSSFLKIRSGDSRKKQKELADNWTGLIKYCDDLYLTTSYKALYYNTLLNNESRQDFTYTTVPYLNPGFTQYMLSKLFDYRKRFYLWGYDGIVNRVLKIFYASRVLKIQELCKFFKNDATTQAFFVNNRATLRQFTSSELFYSYASILSATRELTFFNLRIKKYQPVLKKMIFLNKRQSFFKDVAKTPLYFKNKRDYRDGDYIDSFVKFAYFWRKRRFSKVFIYQMYRGFFFHPQRYKRLRTRQYVEWGYEILLHTTFDVKHRKFLATKRDVLFIALRWAKVLKNRMNRSIKIELLYNASELSLVTKQFIGYDFKQFLFTRIYQKYDEGAYKYIFTNKTYLDNLLNSGTYNSLKYFNKIILPGAKNTHADWNLYFQNFFQQEDFKVFFKIKDFPKMNIHLAQLSWGTVSLTKTEYLHETFDLFNVFNYFFWYTFLCNVELYKLVDVLIYKTIA